MHLSGHLKHWGELGVRQEGCLQGRQSGAWAIGWNRTDTGAGRTTPLRIFRFELTDSADEEGVNVAGKGFRNGQGR